MEEGDRKGGGTQGEGTGCQLEEVAYQKEACYRSLVLANT